MREVDFKHIGAISIRVQTSGNVRNDLAIRVDSVRVYDPQLTVNAPTSGQVAGPFREGVRCYIEAYKSSGVTYQVSAWDAAVIFDESVILKGGGFETAATAGDDGYYPMGDFVIPSIIETELDGLVPHAVARIAYYFAGGGSEVVSWIPDHKKETRRWMVDRQDQVKKVLLLEEMDSLPIP
mgnify:CR=1 FL=1